MLMKCSNCGAGFEGDARFCPVCGAALRTSSAPGGGAYSAPAMGGMIPSRNIALYLILTLLTCGFFGIYWMICLVNDLNAAADAPGDTGGIAVFLLNLVTCGIFGAYWMYKAGEKVAYIRRRDGDFDNGSYCILYLVLYLIGFGIINYCLIQDELNKVAERR